MERHRAVARGYDEIAERYAEASREARTADSYYRSFLDRCVAMLEPGGRVVDLGCGAGLVAKELAARSKVLGVDLSPRQLALASALVPEATFVLADIADLEIRDRGVDGVAAFWSVIHVHRDLHAELYERIHRWLRPGGVLFGTLGSGDNPDELAPDFLGTEMTWSHHDAETNRSLLRDAGFTLEVADVVEDMDERPLWVIARA
jgi:SAM-dependent methyltransferase